MIHILRLGHRPVRDKRITTHVCLTARALGAEKAIITGAKDPKLMDSINNVTKNWGGYFKIEHTRSVKKIIAKYKQEGWFLIHLTMYGEEFKKAMDLIPRDEKYNPIKDLLIIVGGEKVPIEVYKESDLNMSVTFQPHSEVAAVAILLDHLSNFSMYSKEFKGSKMDIIHSVEGKCGLKDEEV